MEHLHDDDEPVGRILSRREAVGLLGGFGATGLLTLYGCSTSNKLDVDTVAQAQAQTPGSTASCAVKPEMTEGPYFVDEKLNRADVRSDAGTGVVKQGSLLALTFNVSRIQSNACTPLPGAQVDIWQCDALGVYSDATDPSFNTKGQNWLRGYQVTDAKGAATFTTILPGWYPGRASHIHFKIRGTPATGSSFDFTSQLFFTEEFLTSAYARAPYDQKSDAGRRRNDSDGIYRRGGSELLVAPSASGSGYAAALNIGLAV
jgi:protocatechuate 3,4-dioxygenase beta subunit